MEKRISRNICMNIILQIVLIISGLIIPRYILKFYGSEMNGLVSSISQFISYAALIEMGIGDASVLALYKPIADGNVADIGGILTSSKRMYRRSGYIYILAILLIASLYPLLFTKQFEYPFIFTLVVCIGSVNVIDYFILGQYKIFLIADQKYYILNLAKVIATIILFILSIFLLFNNVSILWVKFLTVLAHLSETLAIYIYMRTKYSYLNYNSDKIIKIGQRWNALVCQICATIVYNTDLVVLTLFIPGHNLTEISVYTVYNMVFSVLTNILGSFTTGINASFGNLLARGEKKKLLHFFKLYEMFYFILVFIICSSFAVLIVPFVMCYTNGIDDAHYGRYGIGLLFAANGLFAQIKEISGMINMAAGRIKEIQRFGIEEAVLNIFVSLLLVNKFGIAGVLIGTLISHIWMTVRMMNYAAKELLQGTGSRTLWRILRNLFAVIVMVCIELHFINNSSQWSIWLLQGVVITIINGLVITVINFLCEPDLIKEMVGIIKRKMGGILGVS